MAEKKTKTYQQMREELNDILAWFESSEVDVDSALIKYEQAVKLIDELENYLKTAENKISKLTKK